MTTTRRTVLKTGLGAAALVAAPSLGRAQAQVPVARTVRAVLHADLRVFDPIWTTANITSYHGGMIYDTLFALNAQSRPQPQKVSSAGACRTPADLDLPAQGRLAFHDGTPVTAADCVASIRRWGARDSPDSTCSRG